MKIIFIFLFLIYRILAVDDTEWWHYTSIYEVYISSFKDSNGDGVGDFRGITMMLDHFVDLKIDTLWLSPYLKSPMLDMGYDVESLYEVNPLFGTLDDFMELSREMKKRNINLLMDFVINHSSDKSEWFQKSIDRVEPYTDYYVWLDPKGWDPQGRPIPPNNWVNVFTGSAWEWNEKRQQFYLHQFSHEQPDLNLRCQDLMDEIKSIMRLWMDRGVTGFRLDATTHYMEDAEFRDEPQWDPNKRPEDLRYHDINHVYTLHLKESYEVIHQLRVALDEYNAYAHGKERIFVVEAYANVSSTMMYYGTPDWPVAHFPFNFFMVKVWWYYDAYGLDDLIRLYLTNMPKGATPNWQSENHDNHRTAVRFGTDYMDCITTMLMTLPGVACIYFGQEIGMGEFPLRIDQQRDPQSNGPDGNRDRCRLPMQWDDSLNAGFTSNHIPWLPVNPNYWEVNVAAQKHKKHSRYNMFKSLSMLRKTFTAKYGDLSTFIISKWVYAYIRSYRGYPTIIVVYNLGSEMEFIDLHANIKNIPSKLKVITASMNAGYKSGDIISSSPKFPNIVIMRPHSCIVAISDLHYVDDNNPLEIPPYNDDNGIEDKSFEDEDL